MLALGVECHVLLPSPKAQLETAGKLSAALLLSHAAAADAALRTLAPDRGPRVAGESGSGAALSTPSRVLVPGSFVGRALCSVVVSVSNGKVHPGVS